MGVGFGMGCSPWRRALGLLMVVLVATSAASVAVAHGVAHSEGASAATGHGHSHGHSHDDDAPAETDLPALDHERHGAEHAHLEFDSRLPERPDQLLAPLARPTLPDLGNVATVRGSPARDIAETPRGRSRASPRQPRAPPLA